MPVDTTQVASSGMFVMLNSITVLRFDKEETYLNYIHMCHVTVIKGFMQRLIKSVSINSGFIHIAVLSWG